MKSRHITFCCLILLSFFVNNAYADSIKLSKGNYLKYKNDKAVVVYGVNWGTQWQCGGFENAQLQKLSFTRIGSTSDVLIDNNIILRIPSKLLSGNISKSYAILVNPGEYALSEFDVKVARSTNEVGHLKGDLNNLFDNGKPV